MRYRSQICMTAPTLHKECG